MPSDARVRLLESAEDSVELIMDSYIHVRRDTLAYTTAFADHMNLTVYDIKTVARKRMKRITMNSRGRDEASLPPTVWEQLAKKRKWLKSVV